MSLRAVLFAAPLLCLAACTKEDGTSAPTAEVARNSGKALLPSLGKRLAKSNASELRLAPGGKVATWLADAEKPRLSGIPPQMRVGELWAVGVDGGEPRKLANGVINVPGGWLFTPDGRWALVLEGYNAAATNGTLVAVDLQAPGSAPVRLGGGVTYALGSPDSSHVAWVEGGVLKVGPLPGGPFRSVAGEVSTASFTPDGRSLLFRRKLAAAGGLFLAPVADAGAPRKLADHVADFELSPDGTQLAFSARSDVSPSYNDLFLASAPGFVPRRIAHQAWRFGFSPDGKYLARTEGWKSSDEAGDLFVGSASGEGARKVGEKIGRFSFAPDSSAVAFLEFYDPNANGGAGVLGVADLPDGKPRRVGNRVPNYAWGADGRYLAFLSRFMKPVYSVDLMLYVRGEERSVKVRQGAYGYSFSPDNAQLYFRTHCIRDGRACDLVGVSPEKVLGEVQAADGGTPDPAAQPQLLEGLYTFIPSKDGSRLLVTYPRWEAKTYDVATFDVQARRRRSLDSLVQVPPAFASDDGRKVVYVVEDGERSGVYLAREE